MQDISQIEYKISAISDSAISERPYLGMKLLSMVKMFNFQQINASVCL